MARRKILTDEQIAKLPPRSSAYPDPELAGSLHPRSPDRQESVLRCRSRPERQAGLAHDWRHAISYDVAAAREAARETIRGNQDWRQS